ncbi:MAG: AAA family ATPase [Actinobacteria bacterium]|nr:AAA family ATPase [Actinomycetota bacterium]
MVVGEHRACSACTASWPSSMKFCGACGTPLAAEAMARELRLLTILFCDMVGSTELSTRIDPESLADVMRGYYVLCEQVITDAGGYVVKFQGDGVLACFGAPVAWDDAPLRAVRAACTLVEATSTLSMPAGGIAVARAGVHSGQVVVGITGTGTGQVAVDVLGEAANLASRLQGAAEPGAVLISADTAALVPPHVQLVDGTDLQLKGIDRPVRAYRVEGIGEPADELHLRVPGDEVALIDRDAELALLLGRCHLAAHGAPQFAVVVGEPGIGKSRLLREVRDFPTRPPGRVMVLRGLQDRSTTPFAPLLGMLGRHGSDLPPAIAADLTAFLRPERSSGDVDTPERRRRRSIDGVCDALLEVADAEFLLLILDDLHWFDPTSMELLGAIRERAADSRLAVLATARPEWTSPWLSFGDVTTLPLPRLGPSASRRMLADLEISDDALIDEIIDRSEGVPLFLEEYVRHRRSVVGMDSGDVPRTVTDLLHARLERLGPDRELARECSVFGRDIDVDVAAGALGVPPDDLRDRLRRLVQADVLRERFRGHTFSFRHVLLRDAAYESLLRARRVPLHRAAATSIVALGPDVQAQYAEQLARHWTEAGELHAAFDAWVRAARLAADRTAFVEATSHYTMAREVLERVEPSERRDRDELKLILEHGPVVVRMLGGGHPTLSAMYARAEELCIAEQDPVRLGRVLVGLYSFWVSRPDLEKATANLPRLLAVAEAVPSTRFLAYFFAGSTMHLQGHFDEATAHLERSIELMTDVDGNALSPLCVLSFGLLGDMTNRRARDQSAAWYERAFAALERHGDQPFDRAWLELGFAKSLALRGDLHGARDHGRIAADLSAEFDLAQVAVQADCLLAYVDARTTDADEPIDRMKAIIERFDTCGSRSELSMFLVWLVGAMRARGRLEEATTVLAQIDDYVRQTGERLNADAIERERAELLMVG